MLCMRRLSSSFSAWMASRTRMTFCSSWKGCWLSSSLMRRSRFSIVFLVLSLMARWASRSFARFFASCSGVRLATPRDDVPSALRFLPFCTGTYDAPDPSPWATGVLLLLVEGLPSWSWLAGGVPSKLADPLIADMSYCYVTPMKKCIPLRLV